MHLPTGLARVCCLGAALLLGGCGASGTLPDSALALDTSRVPPPDFEIEIPGLGPCTDEPDRTLALNVSSPVTVLVHGCFGSAGKFRRLAQVMAHQGQQTACFSYDDRESLMVSSARLAIAVDRLSDALRQPKITVLGHSQGGLVARRAVVDDRPRRLKTPVDLRLVTISTPFAGIKAASPCADTWLRVATLGFLDLACWSISGDKWHEITSVSNFIRLPGDLLPNVRQHVKIATDEAQTCRKLSADGHCLKDDFVFTLAEQYYPPVDQSPGVRALDLKAGHAGVVGETGEVPEALIGILQDEGVILPTPPERLSTFRRFLRELYRL